MCLQYLKVRSSAPNGIKYSYVPCGKCADCRRRAVSSWKFRLNSTVLALKKKGFNVAFCTLTYRDTSLPCIPQELFEKKSSYKPIPCFSREDVRTWLHSVRHWLKYHCRFVGDDRLRYFVVSEFGSETKRPHYHAILAWPNTLSYERMHSVCSYYWEHGYLFPRYPYGDKGMLSFEVVGDVSKALSYVCKYVCKDLSFYDSLKPYNLIKSSKLYKNCLPFHMQSQSFGYDVLKELDDSELMTLFFDNVYLQGDGVPYHIPLYIRNRILFDNDYVFTKDGRRLVRRKVTDFFLKYRSEIFEKRSQFYEKLFKSATAQQYIDRGIEKRQAEEFFSVSCRYLERVSSTFGSDVVSCGYLGKLYLSYYGVPYEQSKKFNSLDELELIWFARYSLPENWSSFSILDFESWQALQDYFGFVLGALRFCDLWSEYQHSKDDSLHAQILDYFNNVLSSQIKELK